MQPLRIGPSQQGQSSFRLSITRGADDDKRAFGKALRLKPRLTAPTAIFRRCEFGNDALKLVIRAGLKERSTIPGEFLTEQKRVSTRNKLSQLGPSLKQRTLLSVWRGFKKEAPGCVGTNRGFRRSGSKARNP